MSVTEQIGLAALRKLDPERAHTLALAGLRAGLAPLPGPVHLASPENDNCRYGNAQPRWPRRRV